jgi:hypothetical protein
MSYTKKLSTQSYISNCESSILESPQGRCILGGWPLLFSLEWWGRFLVRGVWIPSRLPLEGTNHIQGFLECNDEDVNTSATIILSIEILGPITRSRAQQLNHQVNSFLCSSVYNIESRLLPNDLIVLRN